MSDDGPTLFASLLCYAATKAAGDDWRDVEKEYRANPAACPWPGFQTLANAESLPVERVLAWVDGSGGLSKARCRSAGLFMLSMADVWLSIDDDCLIEPTGIVRLVEVCRRLRGVAYAPYLTRAIDVEKGSLGPAALAGQSLFFNSDGLAPITTWAMGATAIHIDAMMAVADVVPYVEQTFQEPCGYPAAFIEMIHHGKWCNEDHAFAVRCLQKRVPAVAVAGIPTVHAGLPFTLTV